MSVLYAGRVASVLQHYPSLQGVGVMLHHVRPCLPVAVLYPSPLSACFSTLWWFSPGEGSCPTINHRTTGGHYPLWGRLFWVPGGPESLKRCVLRSACREEGGYSWWQRVRVGHLSFKHPFRHFSQVYVMSFVCALKSYHQILSVDCGGYSLQTEWCWRLVPRLVAGRAPLCGCCSASLSPSRGTST